MKKLYAILFSLPLLTLAQNNVSFAVDMNNYSGTFTTVYVSGDFNSWGGTTNALSDADADGVWTGERISSFDAVICNNMVKNRPKSA